jgi:hypothetical protein
MRESGAEPQIAHANGIATDYHINERPMIEQDHFGHLEQNPTFIRTEDWPQIDGVLDWLIEKNRSELDSRARPGAA